MHSYMCIMTAYMYIIHGFMNTWTSFFLWGILGKKGLFKEVPAERQAARQEPRGHSGTGEGLQKADLGQIWHKKGTWRD